jgi:hypothetical protein
VSCSYYSERAKRCKYRFTNHYYRPDDEVLPSGYTVKSAYRGLKKAWLGFKIAKSKDDYDRMIYYSKIVQELQKQLNLSISSFSNLKMSDTLAC